jgi:cobalt/nickel transport system permease protein
LSAIEEPFSEGASLAHRLDPRAKILVAGLFTVLMAMSKSYVATLTWLALALICLSLARLPLRKVITRLLAVNSFVFFSGSSYP